MFKNVSFFFKYGKQEIIIFAVVRCLPELKMKVPVGAVNSLIKESADGALLILSEIFFLENSETSTDSSYYSYKSNSFCRREG